MDARENLNAAKRFAGHAARGAREATETELALLSIAHSLIAIADELMGESVTFAVRAPLLNLPTRPDTPSTATAPADAPAEAGRTGPTT